MRAATRLERAQELAAAAQCRAAGQSERAVAAGVGRPRSTLREWAQAEVASAEVPGALAAFFASVEGVQWLQRLVLALQFVITCAPAAGCAWCVSAWSSVACRRSSAPLTAVSRG